MKSQGIIVVLIGVLVAFVPLRKASAQGGNTQAICSAICGNDNNAFQQAVLTYLGPTTKNNPGQFYYEQAYTTTCAPMIAKDGSADCAHDELNIVQTAIMVKADQIVEWVVNKSCYDFDRKLPSGKSTLEWLDSIVIKGAFANEWEKKNFTNNQEFILGSAFKRRLLHAICTNDTSEYKRVAAAMKGHQNAYAIKYATSFCPPNTFTCSHTQHTVLQAAFCKNSTFLIDFFFSNPESDISVPFDDDFKAWLKKECAERKFTDEEDKSFWMGWKRLLNVE